MGTHPIFESDFDCLTEMLSRTTRIISRNYFRSRRPFSGTYPIDFLEEVELRLKMKMIFKLYSCWNWLTWGLDPDSGKPLKGGEGGVLYQNRNSYKTPFDEDLASCTKSALFGLVNGLENEDSDITEMFCPWSPDLEKKLRKEWKMLSRNDKIYFGEEIFDDCRIFTKKFVTSDGEQFLMAYIYCRVSKLPEIIRDSSRYDVLYNPGDRWGFLYRFDVKLRYDKKTAQWQLQEIHDWPYN